jgi:hypothetical protein
VKNDKLQANMFEPALQISGPVNEDEDNIKFSMRDDIVKFPSMA